MKRGAGRRTVAVLVLLSLSVPAAFLAVELSVRAAAEREWEAALDAWAAIDLGDGTLLVTSDAGVHRRSATRRAEARVWTQEITWVAPVGNGAEPGDSLELSLGGGSSLSMEGGVAVAGEPTRLRVRFEQRRRWLRRELRARVRVLEGDPEAPVVQRVLASLRAIGIGPVLER